MSTSRDGGIARFLKRRAGAIRLSRQARIRFFGMLDEHPEKPPPLREAKKAHQLAMGVTSAKAAIASRACRCCFSLDFAANSGSPLSVTRS